jgi:hypothetical protein
MPENTFKRENSVTIFWLFSGKKIEGKKLDKISPYFGF